MGSGNSAATASDTQSEKSQSQIEAKPRKPKRSRHRPKVRKKTSGDLRAVQGRPFPRKTLEESIRVAYALKEHNGGNAWTPDELATALGMSKKGTQFFYLAAASRDFGLTSGGRDSEQIGLTELGRNLVYAPSPEAERKFKLQAFLNVDVFKRVLEYYKGAKLPEMKYLGNTLQSQFQLAPPVHEEFAELFESNTTYLNIDAGLPPTHGVSPSRISVGTTATSGDDPSLITLAEPESDTGLVCFVAMPFRERDVTRPSGFFDEVLQQLIAPAGRAAGFKVLTARRQGSDVIHSTIVNYLFSADLVIADLSDHNPNVMFELGMRIAVDKPVALIRSRGTGPIFDVDSLVRVFDYAPNLWASTVKTDLPSLTDHIKATWDSATKDRSYLKILRAAAASQPQPT